MVSSSNSTLVPKVNVVPERVAPIACPSLVLLSLYVNKNLSLPKDTSMTSLAPSD